MWRHFSLPSGIGPILCLVALTLQFQTVFWSTPDIITQMLDRDDSFYYFQVARNIALHGVSTFDGIHLTNGVQLLWTGFLVPLAWLVPDKLNYLHAVLLLCVGLNAVIAVQLYRLGRSLHSELAGAIATLLWAGVLFERWSTLQGMEYSLHISIAIAIVSMFWSMLKSDRVETKTLLWFSALLTANYWARLDSALYSVAFWAATLWLLRRKSSLTVRQGASLTTIPLVGAVGYLLTSYAMAHTWLPVSGTVKAVYAQHFFDGYPTWTAVAEHLRWWFKIQLDQFLGLVPESFGGVSMVPRSGEIAILGALVVLTLALGVLLIRKHNQARSALGLLGLMFALSAVHVAIMVIWLADFSHVSQHYYGWLLIFWLLFAALAMATLVSRLSARRATIASLVATAALAVAYAPSTLRYVPVSSREAGELAYDRLQLAQRLDRLLPPDAVIGAWNAGLEGYVFPRPVVNLDGLANDGHFVKVLESGAPIGEYLSAEKITHIVEYDRRDLTARYNEERGTPGSQFRNVIPWSQLEEIDREGTILVLRYKGEPEAGAQDHSGASKPAIARD